MQPRPSQSPQVDYTKRGYYVAIIGVIGTLAGLVIGYFAWQYPKAPNAELQKLISQPVAATPSPTPNIPTPSPSPTSKVETKQRKPTRGINPPQEPPEERCYKTDENGNILYDKGGYEMEVDCEDGTDIEPEG